MGDCAGGILFMIVVGDCACESFVVCFWRGREVREVCIFVGVRETFFVCFWRGWEVRECIFVGVREVIVGVREDIPNYEFQMLFCREF